MIKNNFITIESQEVVYLSPSHQGTMHDKAIADEDGVVFPKGIQLFQDKAYQGFSPQGVHIVQPFKKPRGGTLSKMQRWFNRYVSRIRITVEHAICGVKRCRILKDRCRNYSIQFRDEVVEICTGLHNFRVRSPFREYKSSNKWDLRIHLE
jgi:hypothetical protein